MSIFQQILSDLLQTWPNFLNTAYYVFPWFTWPLFILTFGLSFGIPFVDSFFCLRKIHKLQPRFPGDADVPHYKAARTKLILTTCLFYGISLFLTYPNIVKDPIGPNPGYLYAIGIIMAFIASINYRRSGLFSSTVIASMLFGGQLLLVLEPFWTDSEITALVIGYVAIMATSFMLPADITAFNIFEVYWMDDIAESSNPNNPTIKTTSAG